MFYSKEQAGKIMNRGKNDNAPLTAENEAYHRELAEALGLSWSNYLEINPQLAGSK